MKSKKSIKLVAGIVAVLLFAGIFGGIIYWRSNRLPPERPVTFGGGIKWMEWGNEAFEKAHREGRLVFIFVYAPWNHMSAVINEKAFSSPETAKIIESNFVPVMVNSDLRPDVLLAFNNQFIMGLMTYDGILAGPVPVFEKPGQFGEWAEDVVKRYNGGALKGFALGREGSLLSPENRPGRLDKDILDRAFTYDFPASLYNARSNPPDAELETVRPATMPSYDEFDMAFLWNRIENDKDIRKFLWAELEILDTYRDAEWGGFFRLSGNVEGPGDRREKLLDDNARAIEILLVADQQKYGLEFARRAEQTIEYTLKYLADPKGGFYGGQAADLMTPKGLMAGNDFYGYSGKKRRGIGMPAVDKNIYIDRNAEMAIALLRAADAMDRPELRAAAIKTVDRLVGAAWDEKKGAAHYIDRENRPMMYGMLRDNALLVSALIETYEATGRDGYLKKAEKAADLCFLLFWNDRGAGYVWGVAADPLLARVTGRHQPAWENALMAVSLDRLYYLTGDKAAREMAAKTLEAYAVDYSAGGKAVPPLYAVAVHRHLTFPLEIVVVGNKKDPVTGKLRLAARKFFEPVKIVMTLDPREDAERLAALPYKAQAKPTLYACVETACSMPVNDPEKVDARLRVFTDKFMYKKPGQLLF